MLIKYVNMHLNVNYSWNSFTQTVIRRSIRKETLKTRHYMLTVKRGKVSTGFGGSVPTQRRLLEFYWWRISQAFPSRLLSKEH